MKQVVVSAAGSYGTLRVEDRETQSPGPGEVRVDVEAIGVNYADCLVRMGLYASAKVYVGWPITPGFEVAGRIGAVGEGVDLDVGAPVIALTRFGAYAEQLVVPARQVFPRPEALPVADAAAFPVVNLTAWYALNELAPVRASHHVLVHSAAGGVGGALVQMALNAGAHVVGVVGAADKVAVVEQLARGRPGRLDVVDKSAGDARALWARLEALSPRGYDVVLDANGVETLGQSYSHLAPGGKLVVYGFHTMLPRAHERGFVRRWARIIVGFLRTPRFSPLAMTTENRSVLAFNLSFLFDDHVLMTRAMTELLAWRAAGLLESPPIRTFPLAEVGEAHRALETGRTVGKLVLLTRD